MVRRFRQFSPFESVPRRDRREYAGGLSGSVSATHFVVRREAVPRLQRRFRTAPGGTPPIDSLRNPARFSPSDPDRIRRARTANPLVVFGRSRAGLRIGKRPRLSRARESSADSLASTPRPATRGSPNRRPPRTRERISRDERRPVATPVGEIRGRVVAFRKRCSDSSGTTESKFRRTSPGRTSVGCSRLVAPAPLLCPIQSASVRSPGQFRILAVRPGFPLVCRRFVGR